MNPTPYTKLELMPGKHTLNKESDSKHNTQNYQHSSVHHGGDIAGARHIVQVGVHRDLYIRKLVVLLVGFLVMTHSSSCSPRS